MAPIEGTESGVIIGFILRVPSVAAILTAIVIFVSRKQLRKSCGRYYGVNIIALVLAMTAFGIMAVKVDRQYGIRQYFHAQNGDSSFMDQQYVDPAQVDIEFPEIRRNLIYIYAESMEITYADTASGGSFEVNTIPELTALALEEGDCFNGDSGTLNGGEVLFGASWTMGGLMAQASGAPIVAGINNASMNVADSFYPNLTAIGNILEDDGYTNYFMCGSESVFGGRAQFYADHGNFEIFDYNTALDQGFIPAGYKEWWGFEDEKLFAYARDQILNLASGDTPFNFTMLTADTHFEDGYVCGLCEDQFDVQYSNVMSCSSRQIMAFVRWIQEQDFYENTTIVIAGDHLTMDADYCVEIPEGNRRTYVTIINSAIEPATNQRREYSTFDLFPTTLAAMGCTISGDRLGLGVNLYSDTPTLLETFTSDEINNELRMSGDYYATHFGIPSPFSGSVLIGTGLVEVHTNVSGSMLQAEVLGLENADEMPANVYAQVLNIDGEVINQGDMVLGTDKIYRFDFDGVDTSGDYRLCIFVIDVEGNDINLYSNAIIEEEVEPFEDYSDVEFTFERNGEETARIVYPLLMPSGTVPGWIYVWDDNDPTNIRKYPLSYLRVTNDDGSESIFITNEDVYVADFDPALVNFSIYFYHDDEGVLYSNRYMHALSYE